MHQGGTKHTCAYLFGYHTLKAVITQRVVLLTCVEGEIEAAFNNIHNLQTF